MTQTPDYKYNEDHILDMLKQYIDNTYGEHYAAEKIQTIDVWEALGIAPESCQSNILKYAMRYGKKGGYNSKDLLKILHYTILWYHYTQLAGKGEPSAEDVGDGTFRVTVRGADLPLINDPSTIPRMK